jgi:hypothetical protein
VTHSQGRNRILSQLEEGRIDVDEAIRRLEVGEEPAFSGRGPQSAGARPWAGWWLMPFVAGLGLAALGAWPAAVGGWWWLCAGALLPLGVSLSVIGIASRRSPWVHVRVRTGQQRWPKRIAISLPVPVRSAAWVLRRMGPRWAGLGGTAVDELLLALDASLTAQAPILVEVDRVKSGENVRVYLG